MRSTAPTAGPLGVATALLLTVLAGPASPASEAPLPTPPTTLAARSPAAVAAPPLPVAFVENRGQVDERARFYARLGRLTAYFTSDAFRLRLRPSSGSGAGADLFLTFEGASEEARVHSAADLPARVHSFVGSDPGAWRTNLRAYSRIRYRELYPGVDVEVHGDGERLQYDLVVAPWGDADGVRVRCEGARGLALDDDGTLVIATAAGELRQTPPRTFEIGPDGRSVEVASAFRLIDRDTYGFVVERSDPTARLVIDPMLEYSTYLGGSLCDEAKAIAVGFSGEAYVTGSTQSLDFPTSPGAFDVTQQGEDAFVAKLTAAGDGLVWSTYFGGSSDDRGCAIEVNAAGEAFVAGATRSDDLPTTACAQQPDAGGSEDGFAIRVSADGGVLVYATYLGGAADDRALDIDVDGDDAAYVTGFTDSLDFPTTPCAADDTLDGRDAFAVKLGPRGTLAYATLLGGTSEDTGWGIAVDGDGRAYVGGQTASADFPTTPGAYDTTADGEDVFVARLDRDGAAVEAATLFGGSDLDGARDLDLDDVGQPYVGGLTRSTDLPTTANAFDATPGGGDDALLLRLDRDLENALFASYLGGSGDDVCHGITGDQLGVVYAAGETRSSDLDVTVDAYQRDLAGRADGFYAQVTAARELDYLTYFGGPPDDAALDIALEFFAGKAFLAGVARGDFPTTPGAFMEQFGGGGCDGFVACFVNAPCRSAAFATPVGTGCGATLTSSPPVQGQPVILEVFGAEPHSSVTLVIGLPLQVPLSIEGQCESYVDPGVQFIPVTNVFTDANGYAVRSLPVPNDVVRCGQEAVVQGIVLTPSGPLSFGQLTNAVVLTLGS